MFRTLLFTALFLFSNSSIVSAAEKIRVRTLKNLKSIELSGFGLKVAQLSDDLTQSALPSKKKMKVIYENSGWTIIENDQKRVVSGDRLDFEGSLVRINGEAMSDQLSLFATDSKFEAIAHLPIDEYLKGVVPSEMPIQWPLEALKAQVITARSYAMSMMQKNATQPYDLDDTTQHQVYSMKNYEQASLDRREKVEKAIQETHGLYLTSTSGSPYLSYYHSDCGGATEEPKYVWGNNTRIGTVKDTSCKLNPLSDWQDSLSFSDLSKLIKKTNRLKIEPRIEDVKATAYTSSGRIYELTLYYSVPTQDLNAIAPIQSFKIKGEAFRKYFGYNKIKSTFFNFNLVNDTILLSGRGHGHGVGMCQKGARFMALAGSTFSQIIKRYYPQAKLEKSSYVIASPEGPIQKTQ